MSDTEADYMTAVEAGRQAYVDAGGDPDTYTARLASAKRSGPPDTPVVTAKASAGFSSDQVASGRAAWIEAGLDVAKFDAAVAGISPPVAKTRQADIDTATEALRAAGHDDATIAATLARHGLTAPADTRTEAERDYDSMFGPPPSPADYPINLYGRPDAADGPAWQTALSAMAFPVEIGATVAEMAIDLAARYAGMTEVDRAVWRREEAHSLAEKFGDDGVNLFLAKANEVLARADPAFVEKLKASGVLHSAWMVRMLGHQGARLTRRSTG